MTVIARGADISLFDAETIALDLFDRLAVATSDGVGITRECYAEGEQKALSIFTSAAKTHGLTVDVDPAGNLIVRLPGDDGTLPAHHIGSHADSVPRGGNYDGAAGVVAGLLCLMRLASTGRVPTTPVRTIILRGEESAFFGRANIGSRALFGILDRRDLNARSRGTGRTLAEAMRSCGIDVDPIRAGVTLFERRLAKSYLELHIEQGPVMASRDLPAAIVSGIRGNIRHRRIVCRGETGHSGTVPRWLRKDPVFAFAELLSRLDDHWRVLLERGQDLVLTTGIVSTNRDEGAISRIPGELAFSFEVRSQSAEALEAFYKLFRSECQAIARQRNVQFEFDDHVVTEPALLDEAVIRILSAASESCGLTPTVLPSGAGHDAAVFANAGIPAGMVFVRNTNGSHNPNEAMDVADFLKGVDILFAAVTSG